MFEFTQSGRYRRSAYYDATVADGVTSFMTYNQMMMPTGYGDPEAEYWRLINGVSQWDVAVERQVELFGPDAARLAQILAPRDISKCVVGQGKYVALCNYDGVIVNDPILLKLADDRFWLSIADSNILFWAQAIANERGLNVKVFEPDVSPMALQGPKAEDVVASVFGSWVKDLKYFWFGETEIEGIPLAIARSGWSKQGGFELYLQDSSKGTQLWNIMREAGQTWDIGPGNPNACERIESGLLSWGGDTDEETNPFEVRMGGYVDLDASNDVIGIQALRRLHADGPLRHLLGIVLDVDKPMPANIIWTDIKKDGQKIGDMTNNVWSRRLKRNIGFALVSREFNEGDRVDMCSGGQIYSGELCDLPFC